MRYLPLTDTDRSAMLAKIGAPNIDALFADVPEEARLSGPIKGLPMHASEMAVEKHMRQLSKKNLAAADAAASRLGCASLPGPGSGLGVDLPARRVGGQVLRRVHPSDRDPVANDAHRAG